MKRKIYSSAFILFLISWMAIPAQEQPVWDNTGTPGWPEFCHRVEIPSSLDGTLQPAFVSWADTDEPRPLVVSFHTWSGTYAQTDTLAWICHDRGYHYIHPDFRGTNDHPEACGSPYAIRDIEDAIRFALVQANVDTARIHLTGTSGGGYAVLLAYMNTRFPVSTFSAWVPISDLEKWYHESVGRGSKYAGDILKCTSAGGAASGDPGPFNAAEARKRSPVYMDTPTLLRKDSKLLLYTGIHDGYTGSVPVTQTLEFYNKVVRDFDSTEESALVPERDMLELVASRNFVAAFKRKLAERTVHYERRYRDLARVTVFEGMHEMLPGVALEQVESRRILVIGDSNGAAADSWVEHLRSIRFGDRILNTSVAGNTIGFDNLGNPGLNTRRNTGRYLKMAEDSLGGVDEIIIMLGTNDCKKVFADSLDRVPGNLRELIREIRDTDLARRDEPDIFVVSPPPAGRDEVMLEKYHGSSNRVARLQAGFKEVARSEGCSFVDCYSTLFPNWDAYTKDGIHLVSEGQLIVAEGVAQAISGQPIEP
ncbi:MAG: GDSL-type esterase/lipase family protein [Bacteroidota bacterium]